MLSHIHTMVMTASNRKTALKKVFLWAIIAIICIIIAVLIAFLSVYYSVSLDIDSYLSTAPTVKLFCVNGSTLDLSSFGQNNADYNQLPDSLVNAFVAVEDKRFFTHRGVDYFRLCGAAINNLRAGHLKEGGSTITQQLIKNTEFNSDKKLSRKIKEIRLARQLENKLSKKDIMTKYLNTIYFSNGIYGISDAAKIMFGKTPQELNLSESATLAGLVKNPQKYSPLNSVDNATARRNVVLKLMLDQSLISENDYNETLNIPVVTTEYSDVNTIDGQTAYVREVLRECSEKLDISETALLNSELLIYTAFDPTAQAILDESAEDMLYAAKLAGADNPQCSAVLSDNENGAINAVINTSRHPLARLKRQMGSTVKPFLSYVPAVDNLGYAPSSPVSDIKVDFNGYTPENYKKIYHGDVLLRDAVASSSNSVALQLTNAVGINTARRTAESFGLNLDLDDTSLGIALGGMKYGLTYPALCGAYSALARGGVYITPYYTFKIASSNNAVIYKKTIEKTVATSPDTAYLVNEMLVNCVTSGTAKKLNVIDSEVAAKTGTVGLGQNNSDAVCAAYTSKYTIVSGLYSSDNKEEHLLPSNIGGSSYPLEACKDILQFVSKTPSFFNIPDSILALSIDSLELKQNRTIKLANEFLPIDYCQSESFSERFAPQEVSKNGLIPEHLLSLSVANDTITVGFCTEDNLKYTLTYVENNGERHIADEFNGNGLYYTRTLSPTIDGYVSVELKVNNVYGVSRNYFDGIMYSAPKTDPQTPFRYFRWQFQ